jgi:uncharacterized protein YjlB
MNIEVISKIIKENGRFPNNPFLPILHYKKVLESTDPEEIKIIFESNDWKKAWINSIYPYHHFHSNTHEVLGVASGSCRVQLGGGGGPFITIEEKDVLLIPAGVAHKKVLASEGFECVGSYPLDVDYDMQEGNESDRPKLEELIAQVPLPKTDPVFGSRGPLFSYWGLHSQS